MIRNEEDIKALNKKYRFSDYIDENPYHRDNPDSPINAMPILFKDNGSLAGAPITWGNKNLNENPFYTDVKSNVQTLIESAGGIPVGTTITPEMSLSIVTEPTWRQSLGNYWDQTKTAGGSTGGGAVACAAGAAPICLGSDGGGSIRVPASLNGVLGLKPSRGRTSSGPYNIGNWDGIATSGILTRDVANLSNTLKVLSYPFVGDPFSQPNNIFDYQELQENPIKTAKIGFTSKPPGDLCGIDPTVKMMLLEAVDLLSKDFELTEAYPQKFDDASIRGHFLNIIAANAFKSAGELMTISESNIEDLDPEVQYFYEAGSHITAGSHISTVNETYNWANDAKAWWNDFDILLTPTTASVTPDLGDYGKDPITVADGLTAFSYVQNITGLPSISIPFWFPTSENELATPMGIMMTAAPYKENLLLQMADYIENHRPWSQNYLNSN
jgi:amidase